MQGWGWNDNAYGSLGAPIYFCAGQVFLRPHSDLTFNPTTTRRTRLGKSSPRYSCGSQRAERTTSSEHPRWSPDGHGSFGIDRNSQPGWAPT